MIIFNRFKFIFPLLVLAVLCACSDSNTNAPPANAAHEAVFEMTHGTDAQASLESCKVCHGADLTGNGNALSCYTCHFGPDGSRVPVGSTWIHGSLSDVDAHKAFFANRSVCNRCHEITRAFTENPASCHDCHMISHPLGELWMDKNEIGYHGEVKTANTLDCTPCHGDDYQGGFTGVGCFTCHFDENGSRDVAVLSWVHATSVTSGTHTRPTGLSTYGDVCNSCHNTNRAYNNPPTSCHDCHATHLLGAAWLLPSAHATEAIADDGVCLACHDMDTGGSGIQPACRTCHTATNPNMALGTCSSCHGIATSDGRPDGSVTPNRAEGHSRSDHRVACSECHNGFGTATAGHWYPDHTPPADVSFATGIIMTYSGGTCNGSCHGENHSNDSW